MKLTQGKLNRLEQLKVSNELGKILGTLYDYIPIHMYVSARAEINKIIEFIDKKDQL